MAVIALLLIISLVTQESVSKLMTSKNGKSCPKADKLKDLKVDKSSTVLTGDVFQDVRNHVDKIQNIIENVSSRVQKEKEAFESAYKKLKHVHFSSTIKLNVGGQFFTTSLQTLTKDAGSMLHAMFSGRFDTKPAEDGSYFIDRDGTCFRYILNYLRAGKLNLPDDKQVKKDVLEEAEFYQIKGIVDKLKPKPFSQSVILTEPQQRLWLTEAAGNSSSNLLLYRARNDGWSSLHFHRLCDGKGPTIVVIKSTNGYIFGGYTTQPWDTSGSYKIDGEAFLFSLKSYGSSEPTIMKMRSQYGDHAIYGNSGFGPTFGGGHDLHIVSNPHSNNCAVNIGHTYECPPGHSCTTFLTGDRSFRVAEMEVFELVMEAEY